MPLVGQGHWDSSGPRIPTPRCVHPAVVGAIPRSTSSVEGAKELETRESRRTIRMGDRRWVEGFLYLSLLIQASVWQHLLPPKKSSPNISSARWKPSGIHGKYAPFLRPMLLLTRYLQQVLNSSSTLWCATCAAVKQRMHCESCLRVPPKSTETLSPPLNLRRDSSLSPPRKFSPFAPVPHTSANHASRLGSNLFLQNPAQRSRHLGFWLSAQRQAQEV